MPHIWAPKSGGDLEGSFSSSKMFYPAGITLARKEQLSIIWLAANYDPEKYKKIIPPRECEKANIEHICVAIMNPVVPYALRLSAQLLLGTVRVYRAKTKLILEMAEQMILKLSSLIRETSKKTNELPIAMLRADAITIADTGMSIIDYSLEPVYYDPQMIMHMNEEDFITVNGSPLQSPIKVEKKGATPKKGVTPTKSPIVVNNSKISFQEDLLSPSRPIQVPPSEDDFGALGFGPAPENFLNDLMDVTFKPESLKPKALDFGSVDDDKVAEMTGSRLESVPEDEEMEIPVPIDEQAEKKDPPTVTMEGLEKTEGGEDDKRTMEGYPTVLPTVPSDTTRKRKLEDQGVDVDDKETNITEIAPVELSDLDQLLKEATALGDSILGNVDDTACEKLFADAEEVQQPPADADKEVAEVVEKDTAGDSEFVIEQVDGKSVIMCADETVLGHPGLPMDWEDQLQTPSDTIILKPLPSQPRKRRRLMLDRRPAMTSDEMKNNFDTPENLTRMPVVAGTSLQPAKDLFAAPVLKSRFKKLGDWWTNNRTIGEADAVILPQDYAPEDEAIPVPSVAPPDESVIEVEAARGAGEDLDKEVPLEQAPEEVPPKSPEQSEARVLETPTSKDILRAGSLSEMKSFEKSAGSTHIIETPVDTSKSLSTDHISEGDILLDTGFPQSPRISGIGLMPQEDIEEPPELDVVLEQGEKSIDFMTDLAEEDAVLNENYKRYQRTIFKSLNTSDQTVFQRLFPSSRTKKRDAALALYLTLNMHKNGYVELHQSELFGDIVIKRGRVS